jgi:hypothetical protein
VFPCILLVLFNFRVFLLSTSGSSTLRGSEQRVREKRGLLCRSPPFGLDFHQQPRAADAGNSHQKAVLLLGTRCRAWTAGRRAPGRDRHMCPICLVRVVFRSSGGSWCARLIVRLRPCLDTPAGLELELVYNSSSSTKLTLALKVFG